MQDFMVVAFKYFHLYHSNFRNGFDFFPYEIPGLNLIYQRTKNWGLGNITNIFLKTSLKVCPGKTSKWEMFSDLPSYKSIVRLPNHTTMKFKSEGVPN